MKIADSGIYVIQNTETDKLYVGSAVNFSARFAMHKSQLKAGKHHSIKLQRAWNKYGDEKFTFRRIVSCELNDLLFYEQKALDIFDAVDCGYNVARIAGSRRGVPSSPETKAAISRALIGNSYRFGIPHSEESKLKMSVAHTGRIVSQETRDKISAIHSGKTVSVESRLRMSKAKLGSLQSNSKSGIQGVHWASSKNRWRSVVRVDGAVRVIGYFKEKEDAAKAIAAFNIKTSNKD